LSFGKVEQMTGGPRLHPVQHLNTFLVTHAMQMHAALEQIIVRIMRAALAQTTVLQAQVAELHIMQV
jgi:hypothetical protein